MTSSLKPTLNLVRQIWADTLELPKKDIGNEDNFFALGGSSVLAFMVNTKLEESLYARLPYDGIPVTAISIETNLEKFAAKLDHIMDLAQGEEVEDSTLVDEGTI
ncbi:MAG: hypothetical protein COB46_04350 [Rhodospirillaceae bacterium]|nr:MAG: hypothetical protein COB46_04350 [Rhodospirillaceae bacterium]